MFGHEFYHSLIRKYVTLFGTLFNDIYIQREGSIIKVPISYGPRDKVLARINGDPNLDRPAIVLPRMSFEITDLYYNADRKLNTLHRTSVVNTTNPDRKSATYNPVPYDISFDLSIMVKNTEDGTRIVEQILPFFTPEWTATVELIPEMGITKDIPIVLDRVRMEDDYDQDFEQRRVLTWTLSFTLRGYLYGPVTASKVIKFTNVNLYANLTSNSAVTNINIRPGLTANGTPTANVSESVSLDNIYPDDDYGYIVTITDN